MITLIILAALAQTPSQLPSPPIVGKRMPDLPSKTPPQIMQPIQPTPQSRATPQATPTPMPAQSQYEYEEQYERQPIQVAQLPMTPRIRYRVQRQLVVREILVPSVEYDLGDLADYGGYSASYGGSQFSVGGGFESRVSFGGFAAPACVGGVCGTGTDFGIGVGAGLLGRIRAPGGRLIDKRVVKFRRGPFGGL